MTGFGSARSFIIGHRDCTSAAEAISRRLGRDLVLVDGWDAFDIGRAGRQAQTLYLVAPHETFTQEFVGRLTVTATDVGVPVGLMPVSSRPGGQGGGPAPSLHSEDVLLYSDFLSSRSASTQVFGPGESPAFIERARQGSAATVLQAHGNGADLRVGSQVLCARVAATATTMPEQERLPCQSGGSCRLDQHHRFLAFHQVGGVLRTRLLVLLSCAGYQPAGGILGFDHQLAGQWLGPPDSDRSLVTSTRLAFSKPELAFACARAVSRGLSAGRLALQLNRRSELGEASYVCLGDPTVSVRGAAGPFAKEVQVAHTTAGRPESADDNQGGRFANPRRATQAWLVDTLAGADERAKPIAERLEAAAVDGRGDDNALDFDLCSVLAGVLATRGADFFAAFAVRFGVTAPRHAGVRHYCGSPIRRARLPIPHGAWRALYVCDRCGAVADLPGDRPLATATPAARGGTAGVEVHLKDRLPGWQAVSVVPFGAEDERMASVVRLESRPFVAFEVDTARGNRRYGLVVVSDGDYEIYQGVIWSTHGSVGDVR